MLMRSRSLLWLSLLSAISFAVSWGDEPPSRIDGRRLYEKHCSGCHGDFANTAKGGRSMNRVRTALRTLDHHRQFSSLSDDEILLISLALKEVAD